MRSIVDCSDGLNGTGGITASRAGSGWRFRFDPNVCWGFEPLSFGIS